MRTLIVVLTLVAFWMGAIGRRIAAVNAERRCIVEMEASGAHFLMQSYSLGELTRADWLVHWPTIWLKGESALQRYKHLDVSWKRGITPDFEFVHQFSRLEHLWIGFDTTPKNGFVPLQSHPLLCEVSLDGEYQMSETEVRQLLEIPKIAVINFFYPQTASVESFYELKKHDIEITGEFNATSHELHPDDPTCWSMPCFELKGKWLEAQIAQESQTITEWGNIYDGLHEAPLDNVLELKSFDGTQVQMRWDGRTDGVSAMKQDFYLDAKVVCDSVSVHAPAEYSRQEVEDFSAENCIAIARKQMAAHFDLSCFQTPRLKRRFPFCVVFELKKPGNWILKKP